MITKVISGGQTGADTLGLAAARQLGIPTGGTAPLGYRTEVGTNILLRDMYGLKESDSSSYGPRTHANVQDADMTVIFGDTASAGSKLMIHVCQYYKKPYLTNPDVQTMIDAFTKHNVKVLNVAGNRGSKLTSDFQHEIYNKLIAAIGLFNKQCVLNETKTIPPSSAPESE